MSTSGNQIVIGALEMLGVKDPEQTATHSQLSTGLRRLNMMLGQLALQALTSPVDLREVFPLVANKGGTGAGGAGTGPYTIGPGGDFNTTRPLVLTGAGLVFGSTVYPNELEISRAILTSDAYNAEPMKDLQNDLFTGVYYNATYAGGLGSINLWPVPNTALHSLVLYRRQTLATITNGAASYDLPPGADEMLEANLAMRLAAPNHVPLASVGDVVALARSSLRNFKMANVEMADLVTDLPGTGPAGGYDINTGDYH